MGGGGRLGARGSIRGSVMVKTLLQPAREDLEENVFVELPLSEARPGVVAQCSAVAMNIEQQLIYRALSA